MLSNEGINHDTCGICIQKIQELARFETFGLGIHYFWQFLRMKWPLSLNWYIEQPSCTNILYKHAVAYTKLSMQCYNWDRCLDSTRIVCDHSRTRFDSMGRPQRIIAIHQLVNLPLVSKKSSFGRNIILSWILLRRCIQCTPQTFSSSIVPHVKDQPNLYRKSRHKYKYNI